MLSKTDAALLVKQQWQCKCELDINPLVPNALFCYQLKTSENRTVFLYFQGLERERGCIGNEWVNFKNLCNFISLRAFTVYVGCSLQSEISLRSNNQNEILTKAISILSEFIRALIMRLLYTKVKSETDLSSLWVSYKCARGS